MPILTEKYYQAVIGLIQVLIVLIEKADLTTKQEIEKLIAGDTIEKPIYEDITYDEVYKNMNNLWNFMYFTGYLKKVGERMCNRNI